jgi:hypothetical protein
MLSARASFLFDSNLRPRVTTTMSAVRQQGDPRRDGMSMLFGALGDSASLFDSLDVAATLSCRCG